MYEKSPNYSSTQKSKLISDAATLTKPATDHNIPPHNKGGNNQLTCKSCNLSYVGQTSQNLKISFQEHIRYIKEHNPQSAYDQHILHNQHKYGTLNEIMTLLKPLKHENMLISYEQFHIQSLHQAGNLIPEQYHSEPNPFFNWPSTTAPTPYKTEPVEQYPANRTQSTVTHQTNDL